MERYFNFDNFIKFIIVALALNATAILMYYSWIGVEGQWLNLILSNSKFIWQYFGLLGLCFVWLMKGKIISISLSVIGGFKAKLIQIQKEKDAIIDLKNEIRGLALEMLESHITIIENSKRWCGWTEDRYNEAIDKVNNKCKTLDCTTDEGKKIFQDKLFWDEVDRVKLEKDASLVGVLDKNKSPFNAEP